MIETLVLFGHLLVAGLIIALVLLQRGKGAEAGTGFGAGASGTVFGSRGSASFFSRATAVLAALFFASSLALAYFATQTSGPVSTLEGLMIDSTAPEVEIARPPSGSAEGAGAAQDAVSDLPAFEEVQTPGGGSAEDVPLDVPAEAQGQPAEQ